MIKLTKLYLQRHDKNMSSGLSFLKSVHVRFTLTIGDSPLQVTWCLGHLSKADSVEPTKQLRLFSLLQHELTWGQYLNLGEELYILFRTRQTLALKLSIHHFQQFLLFPYTAFPPLKSSLTLPNWQEFVFTRILFCFQCIILRKHNIHEVTLLSTDTSACISNPSAWVSLPPHPQQEHCNILMSRKWPRSLTHAKEES